MAASAFQRLLRILDLEEKQSWRNRGVIGGMKAMAARWEADARAENEDPAAILALVNLMGDYDRAAQADRPALAAAMRAALEGELPPEPSEKSEASQKVEDDDAPLPDIPDGLPPGQDEDEFEPEYEDEYGADEPEDPSSGVRTPRLPPPLPTNVAARRAAQQRGVQRSKNPADLSASPSILSGIGPNRLELLNTLGIATVADLLWHLPHRHEDYSSLRTIAELQPGEQVTIIANLWDVKERKLSHNRKMVQGILSDGTGTLHATWWNPWIAKQLKVNSTMRWSGKVGLYLGQKTLDNPAFEEADEEMVATGRLAPVYPLTEGVTNNWLRGLIRQTLDGYAHLLADPLPEELRREYNLPDLPTALAQAHFPDTAEALAAALRRLAFEELLYVQLGVLQRRAALREGTAPDFHIEPETMEGFLAGLPFEPTGAQRRAFEEIAMDLRRSVPMTRLVQGDVGSGKTAVAAGAMYLAALNGAQSAMLAPTQILAEQHHRTLSSLMERLALPDGRSLRVALLTGRVTGEARQRVIAELQDGSIDVVVGTTALIQEWVEFNHLGLIVVDEQHRFGVEQRGALRTKGALQPHVLVMSATPIPRSLALTVYGDLDVSIIDEKPAGRQEITTKLFRPRERERLYAFIRREAREGRQAFIIYPLVEESEKLDVGAAVEAHERLRRDIFPNLSVGLLHGRMAGGEKDETMRAFAEGEFDVLVATSVVEVGIDVPNASVIMIEDAERFGLAQLHQFRGRVGRGEQQSYCALVSKAEGGDAQERLNALVATNDGFVLAEKDLELRGPGDFLGTRQSGLPELRFAQLTDVATVGEARAAAQRLFAADPDLALHPGLLAGVQRFWRGHGDIS